MGKIAYFILIVLLAGAGAYMAMGGGWDDHRGRGNLSIWPSCEVSLAS